MSKFQCRCIMNDAVVAVLLVCVCAFIHFSEEMVAMVIQTLHGIPANIWSSSWTEFFVTLQTARCWAQGCTAIKGFVQQRTRTRTQMGYLQEAGKYLFSRHIGTLVAFNSFPAHWGIMDGPLESLVGHGAVKRDLVCESLACVIWAIYAHMDMILTWHHSDIFTFFMFDVFHCGCLQRKMALSVFSVQLKSNQGCIYSSAVGFEMSLETRPKTTF